MSVILDALKRVKPGPKTPENVIQVPASRRGASRETVLLIGLLCLLVTGLALHVERKLGRERHADIVTQMKALETRQEELFAKIRTDDPYLDTRVQIDVYELKDGFSALGARVDAMKEEADSIGAGYRALEAELRNEMRVVSKRLHRVERDHSILADRLDAVTSTPFPAEAGA